MTSSTASEEGGTMATATTETTIADLLESLGGIPARRVLFKPLPGTATERDLVALSERNNRLYELVDGTLVEKAMGFDEAIFGYFLGLDLGNYIRTHDLGKPVGDGALMRLFPGLVRIPDAAFISWERYPRKKRRRGEIPTLAPDLVVEVLSKDNTRKEMARKLREYFKAGVRLVWYVDPSKRTVTVYTAVDRWTVLTEDNTLDGGDVLPGFSLSIRDWFADAERTGPRRP
jgi:Uma2 family endonuclease